VNLILVLAAHETAHSTAPRARLQNGLHRPGDYGVYRCPRTIFSPERLSPAGAAQDFRDIKIQVRDAVNTVPTRHPMSRVRLALYFRRRSGTSRG
jgi:hypothetical protein